MDMHEPYQMTLTPLALRRTEPAAFGSADCKMIGVGLDGIEYVLKYVEDAHPKVPASEWICTHLARDAQLAVAACHVAEDPVSNTLMFATRVEGGVQPAEERLRDGLVSDHAQTLSEWLAFDLFIHNDDRHFGNFLVRDGLTGQLLLGIDFSRALLVNDWPSTTPPVHAGCNTLWWFKHVDGPRHYPAAAAQSLLERLADLPNDWMGLTVKDVPSAWLCDAEKAVLERWWRLGRKRRIRKMIEAIHDGKCLPILAGTCSP